MAVAEYVLHHDVEQFRWNLATTARQQLAELQAYDAKGVVSQDGSVQSVYYVERYLLLALAAADFPLAIELARSLGGRPIEEAKNDIPRSLVRGHALKYAVLQQDDEVQSRIDHWEALERAEWPLIAGYPVVVRGILQRDAALASAGLREVAAGHAKLVKRVNGGCKDSAEELLSFRGIGIANLARWRGIAIEACPPFIPEDLLIAVT